MGEQCFRDQSAVPVCVDPRDVILWTIYGSKVPEPRGLGLLDESLGVVVDQARVDPGSRRPFVVVHPFLQFVDGDVAEASSFEIIQESLQPEFECGNGAFPPVIALDQAWIDNETLLKKMEPVVGIEPTTYGLRNRCSATELHWPTSKHRSRSD